MIIMRYINTFTGMINCISMISDLQSVMVLVLEVGVVERVDCLALILAYTELEQRTCTMSTSQYNQKS